MDITVDNSSSGKAVLAKAYRNFVFRVYRKDSTVPKSVKRQPARENMFKPNKVYRAVFR